MIYISISLILLFLFLLSLCSKSVDKKITSIVAFLILFFLNYFRADVGTDYHSYLTLWNSIVSGLSTWYKEPGFVFSVKMSSYLGFNGVAYLTVLSLSTIVIGYLAALRLKINITCFLLFYFLFLYLGYVFNIMRQGIAMSLFLLAVGFLFSGKKYKFFIASFFAASFHYISLLIGVVYFWCKIRLKFILLIVLGLVGLKLTGAMAFIVSFVFTNFFPSKVDAYVTSATNELTLINIVQRGLLLSFLLFVYYLSGKEKIILFLLKVYLLGFGLYFLLSDYSIISGRIYMFFCISVPAIYARFCYIRKSNFDKILLGLCLFAILFPSLWILAYTPEFYYTIR